MSQIISIYISLLQGFFSEHYTHNMALFTQQRTQSDETLIQSQELRWIQMNSLAAHVQGQMSRNGTYTILTNQTAVFNRSHFLLICCIAADQSELQKAQQPLPWLCIVWLHPKQFEFVTGTSKRFTHSYVTLYCKAGIFCRAKFLQNYDLLYHRKFSQIKFLWKQTFEINLLAFTKCEVSQLQFVPEMLAMEIFVKLCSIMLMDALISGMQTRFTSGSGLAYARLGTDSSRLNQKREQPHRV